ncbi:MAG: flagellar filament capping protein FliD [Steroidobacteraceae bacterium]
MATITSTGIGSGLDISSMVSQLVAAERKPADERLAKTDTRLTAELSAVSKLKGALSTFESALSALKTPSTFEPRTATSADEKAFTATATASAAPGRYDVEVRQLATAARLGSQLFASGPDSVVGTGTLTIGVGQNSFSIEVGAGSNTLAAIRDAINNSPDNRGVRAMLIRDTTGTGSYLVLAGSETGAANAITVSAGNADAGLDGLVQALNDFDAEKDVAAQDAVAYVSGYEIRSASNTVSGAIDGVTLNLKTAEAGTTVPLTIERDDAQMRSRVEGFVAAYNALATQVKALGAYDAATKTGGPLLGDAMLRGIDTQLRRLVSDPVAGLSGDFRSLASVGISMSVSGTLELDSKRFDAAMAADPASVGRVFASESGVAVRLDQFLDQKLSSTSDLAARNTTLSDRLKDLQKQRDALDARMQIVEARYQRQFTAMDTLLGQLQSTSSYLTQQLDGLSKLASGNSK